MDNIRIDARMALATYESSVAAFGKEAHFSIKNVHDVRAYIDRLESALRKIAAIEDEVINVPKTEEGAHLWTSLAMCVELSEAALGEKKDR